MKKSAKVIVCALAVYLLLLRLLLAAESGARVIVSAVETPCVPSAIVPVWTTCAACAWPKAQSTNSAADTILPDCVIFVFMLFSPVFTCSRFLRIFYQTACKRSNQLHGRREYAMPGVMCAPMPGIVV